MNLAEWHAVLDTEPATPSQIGVILREFARLGVDDRAERLAISAALLDLEELGSTAHLVMGQAGRLYRILLGIRDRAELPAVTVLVAVDQDEPADLVGQDQARVPEHVTLIGAIQAVILTLLRATSEARKPADVRINVGATANTGRIPDDRA